MKYVFIDTNVFLNFYSFTKDHLNKLEEVIQLLKTNQIVLILPEQVIDEFKRNREKKLKTTLDYLDTFSIKLNSPSACQDIREMKEIQQKINSLRELSKKLKLKLIKAIKNKSLDADLLIKHIFSITPKIDISEKIIQNAKRRFDVGNPPGKNGSLGDAINWECVLKQLPFGEDLYFIGEDNDYTSIIDPNSFSSFLIDELKIKKNSKIRYYKSISEFLKEQFVNSKITTVDIKEEQKIVHTGGLMVKVVCKHCNSLLEWRWGRSKGFCPTCGSIKINDVRLAKGEIDKLFQ